MSDQHLSPESSEPASSVAVSPPPKTIGPVTAAERLGAVDTLRGFALLGILVINILVFALPDQTIDRPAIAGGITGINLAVWFVSYVFFYQKFMALFSMLFGAGLVLMARRAADIDAAFKRTYYRRLGWLMAIAFVHAYFLWWGDILYFYAMCGLLLYPLRRLSPKALITVGLISFMVASLFLVGMGTLVSHAQAGHLEAEAARQAGDEPTSDQVMMENIWVSIQDQVNPPPEKIAAQIEEYRGGYGTVFLARIPKVLMMHTFIFAVHIFWHTLGLMLIGMGLMKLDVFSARRSRALYLTFILAGYGIGLPLAAYHAWQYMIFDFDIAYLFGLNAVTTRITVPAISLGHIGLIMMACREGLLSWLTSRLAAVGRMALSNYLMHTVIFTTIFYGYGLGFFGDFNRIGLMGFVVAMWLLQLYLSPLWLNHFRFGPAEWLWRSLTYRKKQPMKTTASVITGQT